jgi:hypothetical protein
LSARGLRAVVAALVVLALVAPIWAVPIPPLSDYVNHLARAHVLAHLSDSAAYADAYRNAWGPYPNLAFDLFAVPLTKALDVVVVGKLFLTLTVLVWCGGCHALAQATLGRMAWRTLVACFFVTCEPFLLGYANFAFGMGFALFSVAAILRGRDKGGLAWGLAAALSLVTAASHAAAIVTLVIAAGALATSRLFLDRAGVRRAAAPLLAVAPGAAYFVFWALFLADKSKDRSWASPGTSLRTLLTSILPTYEARADLPLLAGLALAATLALVLLRPRAVDAPIALAAGLCALAVFVSPADFAGSYEANGRYALGAWTFGLFAARRGDGDLGRLRLPVALALGLLFARQGLVTRAWLTLGRELTSERELLRKLPERAVLANVTFLDRGAPRSTRLRQLALLHAPALAVLDRDATVPTLYAIPGVQPLAHRRALYDAHRFRSGEPGDVDLERLRREMTAVWLCRGEEPVTSGVRAMGTVAGRSGECELVVKRP